MEQETLLKRLEDIKISVFDREGKLSALIADVRKELLLSGFKGSEKGRLKYCLSCCEKTSCSARPILAFSHHENGLQYYCNGNASLAVELHGEDIMNDLPRHDQPYDFKSGRLDCTSYEYPNVKNAMKASGEICDVDLKELYNFTRVNKNKNYVCLVYAGSEIKFNPKVLLSALTFANMFKGKGVLTYQNNTMKPIQIEKENGTKLIVVPIRVDYLPKEEDVNFIVKEGK